MPIKTALLFLALCISQILPAQIPGLIMQSSADAPLQNAAIKKEKDLVSWINKVRASIPRWFKELVPGGDVPEVMKAIGGGYPALNYTVVDTLNLTQLTALAFQCHINGYLLSETELLCFAAKIKPVDYNLVNNIGANLVIIGKPQVGIIVLKYLAAAGYKDATLYNNLGQAYYALQNEAMAQKYLDTSISIYPTGHANATKGKIAEEKGDNDKAIDDYKNALKETFNQQASERLDELAPGVDQSALLNNSPYNTAANSAAGNISYNILVPGMPNGVDDYYNISAEAGALLNALILQSSNLANQAAAVYVAHAVNNSNTKHYAKGSITVIPLNIEKKLQKIFIAVDEQYRDLMFKKRETLTSNMQGVVTNYATQWNAMQKDFTKQLEDCKNDNCTERVKNTFCTASKKLVSQLIQATAPSYHQLFTECANITKQRLQLADKYAPQFFDKEDKKVAAQDVVIQKKGILDDYAGIIATGVSAFMEPMGCEKHKDGSFTAPDVPPATVPPCPVISVSVPTKGSLVIDCSELHIEGDIGLGEIKGIEVAKLAFEYERQIQKHENTITVGPTVGPAGAQISITISDSWQVSDVSIKGSLGSKSVTYSTMCGLY